MEIMYRIKIREIAKSVTERIRVFDKMDERWLFSVYSDGSEAFVSSPIPTFGEKVTIKIRVDEQSPVKHVFLRTLVNGSEYLTEMKCAECQDGLQYYKTSIKVQEPVICYQFYLVTETQIFYYTQAGITTYVPDRTYDFKLITDYEQPKWVRGAVFYQIFPDRFCNGNPENDVKDGEYIFDGHPTIQVKDWNSVPLPFRKGHCLDFYGGDLEGIREKIPYLKELGVTALYINPIFHAATNHKYDCLDYFMVDPHLGGDKALAELSEALHKEGMKLILDVSVNHTGTAHKWFNKEGIFFDKTVGAYNNKDSQERSYYFFQEDNSYKAWFDVDTLPTLNYTSEELRQTIYEGEDSLVKKWLKPPFSTDGWRFDVADVMARNNELQLQHEVWPGIRKSIKETNKEAYILAEDWGDCSEYLQGSEWDSPMNYYGFGRCVRQFCGEPDLFNMRDAVLRQVPYRMTAEDLKCRITEHLAKLPHVIQEIQFNLLDSHDVPRLHNNKKITAGTYEGAVEMLFTMPGAANIYYGDELAIDGTLETHEGCRYPMPWNRLEGGLEGRNDKVADYYHMYQKLANLKAQSPAIREGGFKILYAEGYVFAYTRFVAEEAYLFVWSRETEEKQVTIPLDVLGSRSVQSVQDVMGKELNYHQEGKDLLLTIPADTAYLIKV